MSSIDHLGPEMGGPLPDAGPAADPLANHVVLNGWDQLLEAIATNLLPEHPP